MPYSRSIDPSIMLWAPFDGKPSLESEIGPTFAITRATQASYRDHEGLIRYAPSGDARFQGSKRELNAYTYSNDLEGADWSNVRNDVSHTTTVSPPLKLGPTVPVFRVNDDNLGGTGSIYHLQTFDLLADGTYTWRIFVKPGDQEGTGYFMQTNALGGANGTTDFEYTTNQIDLAGNHDDAGIVAYDDGWYQLWVTFTVDPGDTGGQIYMGPGEDFTISLNRDGSHEHWVCAPQLYQGPYNENQAYHATGASAYDEQVYSPGDSNEPQRGLCVEEARTNICLQSEDFGTTWTNVRSTESTNTVVSPDGTQNADTIQEDGTAASTHYMEMPSLTTSAATYTVSCFLKAANRTWAYVDVSDGGGTNIAYFDLANGATGASTGATELQIEDYGNGWYRCIMIFTALAAAGTAAVRVGPAEADNDPTFDGLSQDSIYAWGAQLELGSNPSSYIRTTTSSATRNAELVQSTDTTWATWSESVGLTLCSKAQMLHKMQDGVDALNVFYLRGSDSGTVRYSHLCQSTLNPQLYSTTTGGASDMAITLATNGYGDDYPTGTPTYHASGIAQNDVYTVEGGTSGTDTGHDCWDSSVYNDITLGGTPGGGEIQTVLIQELLFFDERKDNNFLDDYSNGSVSALQISPSVNQLKGMHLSSLPTSTDARWHEIINSSGITKTGDFIDDAHQALEALTSDTGDFATLFKKYQRDYMMWDSETLRTAGGFDPNRDYDVAWDFKNRPTLTSLKGDNTLTYTRASTMTNVDENGFIYTIGVDVPPFWGHRHTTPLNDDATNVGQSSPGWTNVRINRTQSVEIAPPAELAGQPGRVQEVSLIQEDGTASNNHYATDGSYLWQGGFRHSVYVKKYEGNTAKRYVYLRCSGASVSTQVTWDLDDIGAGGIRDEDFSSNIGEWGQYDCGNGWWRIWATGTASGNDMNGIIIGLSDDPSADLQLYNGNNNDGCYIAGWLLEAIPQSDASQFPAVGAPTATDFVDQDAADPFQTRYHHGSAVGEGLLLEPVETNLIPYSADLDNGAWNPTAAITAHDTTGPDGQLSGHKIEDTDGAAFEYIQDSVAYTANTDVCISLFVRKDSTPASTRFALLRIVLSGGTSTTLDLYFDTSTGDTNPVVLSGPGSIVTSGVEDYGDWWRFWIVGNDNDNANTTGGYWLYPAVGANADLQTISNTVTGFVHAWGAQWEVNDSPTSYIPTAGVAATRATPYCSTTDITFLSDNSYEGTVYSESSVWNDRGGSKIVWQFDDNSTNNRTLLYTSGGYDAIFLGINGAATQWNIIGTENSFASGNYASSCISFATNDIEGWAGGVQTGTDTSATPPTAVDRLWFGMRTGSADVFGGFISKWAYWSTLKPSSFMERASTDDSSVLK